MMNKTHWLIRGAAAAGMTVAVMAAAAPAHAGNIENMERERSIMLHNLMDHDLSAGERQTKTETSARRLVDLERLVLRDDSLTGKATPTIRRAFENYDLTFLVHAAAEKNESVLDLWLAQVGITTGTLMAAERKYR